MARTKTPRPRIHQMTVKQFEAMFPDEEACKSYLLDNRWPEHVYCPRCGNVNVRPHARPYHWQCYACTPGGGYRFSVLVGTVFENTNIDLRQWFRVIHLMVTSKKGISALQVYRYMGFGSYKTAWYMCHRIRAGLADEDFRKLVGIVEVDETFIGGKWKNRHKDRRGGGGGSGGMGSGKTPIAGAVSRKGNVVARVIENVRMDTLRQFVREAVSHKVSLICTDDNRAYRYLDREFPHGAVRHSNGEYVAGVVHTQAIEDFWSLVKRGMVGTFHKVSRKYLPLYVAEFQFRYNNRETVDIFGEAVRAC
jgi:transposase-like protein/IS1 family transposase